MDLEYRPLTQTEVQVLERLLQRSFVGAEELRRQIYNAEARQIIDDGTLALSCTGGAVPSPARGLVAEGTYQDRDGTTISVLLHVDNSGFLKMLEVLKPGPSPVVQPPVAANLDVL